MKINFKINTLKEEELRIKISLEKMPWFREKGYIVVLPKTSLGSEYRLADYESRADLIKKEWKKIEKDFLRKTEEIFSDGLGSDIEVNFTKYGVGGSYYLPNQIIVNISDEYRKMVRHDTIAHEIIHLYLEPFVQKYRIEHWQKERIVALLVSKILEEYYFQKIPIETKMIDDIFEKFYPNIEKICLEVSGKV